MIFWILWGACSVVVFKHVIKSLIKEEVEDWGEIDTESLIMFTLLSAAVSLLGPIAIIAYILYNVAAGIAQAISEEYKK
jgi:hypothetical protein